MSGSGKTTLAYLLLSRLGWESSHITGPPYFYFDESRRFHFLDEIHELATPEILYPYLSSEQYTIILATNQTGDLLEPLRNRCQYILEFDTYTSSELSAMCHHLFRCQGYDNMPEEIIDFLVDRCGNIPRVLKNLVLRFSVLFRSGQAITVENMNVIAQEILNLDPSGLGPHERLYLNFLRQAGGSASLGLISGGTGLSESTIKRIVEPNLIFRGLITVTSRGRHLCN